MRFVLYYNQISHGTKLWRHKTWQIAANKDFGGQNIGELAALYCKIAWIKIVGT